MSSALNIGFSPTGKMANVTAQNRGIRVYRNPQQKSVTVEMQVLARTDVYDTQLVCISLRVVSAPYKKCMFFTLGHSFIHSAMSVKRNCTRFFDTFPCSC